MGAVKTKYVKVYIYLLLLVYEKEKETSYLDLSLRQRCDGSVIHFHVSRERDKVLVQ